MLCYVMSWRSLLTSTLDVSNFRYKSTSRTHVGVSETLEKKNKNKLAGACHAISHHNDDIVMTVYDSSYLTSYSSTHSRPLIPSLPDSIDETKSVVLTLGVRDAVKSGGFTIMAKKPLQLYFYF